MRSYPQRQCAACGVGFEPHHYNQKVCSAECRHGLENARKRRHEKTRRAVCIDCGELLGAGSAYPSNPALRCHPCSASLVAKRVDDRARKIEEWWAEGLTVKQIGARLAWSTNRVGVELHKLRERGHNLPYRRVPSEPAFPEQVAA